MTPYLSMSELFANAEHAILFTDECGCEDCRADWEASIHYISGILFCAYGEGVALLN